ncbi:SDR family NAD(P)-dependent oxidoreductase [Listeria immobilis]|uniref:SDR family NAD(P)-dependent oxidoreductase n=1 Tax=Listeria immobilis TaxID=2713502 RepID=UPI001629BAAB|nr:SDR family oxidoreductase [Listeria immobilis]MBC1517149.1 SDR family oxidoreductase [Listeria immobilis]MBC6298331.1 SDR family oxidoreductase [Listeria immobilis]
MNTFLRNKTVMITGASSGLGAEIARQVAASGANVILMARSTEKLKVLQAEISADFAVDAEYFTLDMTDFEQIMQLSEKVNQNFRVDVLVNCAGFGLFENAVDIPFDITNKMFDTNVLGLIRLTQLILPAMQSRQTGHIINIASQAGKIATPKSSVYSATKYAIIGFSNALRLEVASDNINVTAINPGPIATNFFEVADQSGEYLDSVGKFVLKPEHVARRTVQIMGNNRREVNLPFIMNIGTRIYQIMPAFIDFIGKRSFFK